jgi:hypothetical protein
MIRIQKYFWRWLGKICFRVYLGKNEFSKDVIALKLNELQNWELKLLIWHDLEGLINSIKGFN